MTPTEARGHVKPPGLLLSPRLGSAVETELNLRAVPKLWLFADGGCVKWLKRVTGFAELLEEHQDSICSHRRGGNSRKANLTDTSE